MTQITSSPSRSQALDRQQHDAGANPGSKAPYVALAVFSGMLMAFNARINGILTGYLGSPFFTAAVSGVGVLTVTSLIMAGSPAGRQAYRRIRDGIKNKSLPRWHTWGGISGAWAQFSQAIAVPHLGVATTVVASTAGQNAGGLIMDASGLAPGGKRLITLARTLGPLVAMGAAVLTASAHFGNVTMLWLALLPFIAGLLQAGQQAVNGRVRASAAGQNLTNRSLDLTPPADPKLRAQWERAALYAVTFRNFLIGASSLLLLFAASVAFGGMPHAQMPSQPWMLLVGTVGVIFIGINAAVVAKIGVVLLGLGIIAGQVSGGLISDLLIGGTRPTAVTWAAAGLTIIAVCIPLAFSRTPGRADS